MTARERVYLEFHGTGEPGLTGIQRILFVAILLSVGLAILGTEPELSPEASRAIDLAELGFGALFLVEYLARVWACPSNPEYAGPGGRWRYIRRPVPLVDLVALLPFFLGAIGGESLVLRLFRVLRLLALSKLVRYSEAMRVVMTSVIERRFELVFAVSVAALAILISSAGLYLAEGGAQPKQFGSILRSMWWSIVTLTTVGYGDVVPITPLGKVFAGITSLAGIAMIALPTGILAACFSDGFARARRARDPGQYE